MKKSLLVLALMSLLLAGGVTATAATKVVVKKVTTKATIKFSSGSGPYDEGARFRGKVKAKKGACRKDRVITIRSKNDGRVVGRTTSNRKGKYDTGVNNRFEPGKYFAEVKKRQIVKEKKNKRVRIICLKGRSKAIRAS